MLTITRRMSHPNEILTDSEYIVITNEQDGTQLFLYFKDHTRGQVKVGIQAPAQYRIVRSELLERNKSND